MNIVVLYESLTGNTRRVAELVGGAARSAGADVAVRPVSEPDLHELAEADAIIIGTWTDGLVLFGMRPAAANRLRALPVIEHKPVGVFCTYAVNPGRTLDKLAAIVEGRGGKVVAGQAFKRSDLETRVPDFVAEVMVSVTA